MSHFRFVFVVLCFTAVLIIAVYVRSVNNRLFYQICVCNAERERLKQDLGTKQLRLESLINPASLSQRLGQDRQTTDEGR
ncbi:MAG: hypothetical protein P8Z79_19665 [Sedimentisphaerales bacterium]|jgi:hypothetical protein